MKIIYALITLCFISAAGISRAAVSTEEAVAVKGIKSTATARYDKFGIPSIEADSLYDLGFAQGYVHARDRLWQMDMNRRQATGRMAAIFGKGRVGGDYSVHLARLPEVSKEIWDECIPSECELFQAYADGVNAYISSLKEPPEEYARLGIAPEPWSPVDSVAIGRGMAWGLSSDLGIEIAIGVIVKLVGEKTVMKLLPFEGVDPITIVQPDEMSSFPEKEFDDRIAERLGDWIFSSGRKDFSPSLGSNNWVVAGARTDSGNPMLSNDTHMGFPSPCDWYEVHLKAPGLHVAGLSVPGAPGILIGHNDRIAWGVTQARYDVSDAYVEKLDPERPDTHYLHMGKSIPFDVQNIKIKYKKDDGGFDFEERSVLHTVHGPVVYENERPRSVISFRWTGHEPSHEDLAFLGFMTAGNLSEFKTALDHFEVGAQNFVYADVDGNIYYRSQGRVPLRKGKPYMPLDGSSGKYEWQGYIPYDELPQLENPARGFVVTANNRLAPASFKHYIGAFFDKGYRARRITDLILAAAPMTFRGMQDIQTDVYSLDAKYLLPLLYGAAERRPDLLSAGGAAALEILKKWDLFSKKEYVEPSIFYNWLHFCTVNIFKDNVPGDVFGDLGRTEVIYPFLLNDQKLPIDFYDDTTTGDVRETKDMMLVKSLNDAAADLEERLGADPSGWTWGKIHKVDLNHKLGGEFNVGPEPGDGGADTVNVADFGLSGGGFNFGHGPNMRMTTELSPGGVRGENVIMGGQSGDRKNPNYSDQFYMWLRGETHPMPFSEPEVAAGTVRSLVLTPE